MTSHTLKRG
ncbi:unnamed protein product, partial [Allacma fusca]